MAIIGVKVVFSLNIFCSLMRNRQEKMKIPWTNDILQGGGGVIF